MGIIRSRKKKMKDDINAMENDEIRAVYALVKLSLLDDNYELPAECKGCPGDAGCC